MEISEIPDPVSKKHGHFREKWRNDGALYLVENDAMLLLLAYALEDPQRHSYWAQQFGILLSKQVDFMCFEEQ